MRALAPPTAAMSAVARRLWGVAVAELHPLPGYDDLNYRVVDESGRRFVLKLAAMDATRDVLEMQSAAAAHLRARAPRIAVPTALPLRDGTTVASVGFNEGPRLVRMLTWVPGQMLVDHPPGSTTLISAVINKETHESREATQCYLNIKKQRRPLHCTTP